MSKQPDVKRTGLFALGWEEKLEMKDELFADNVRVPTKNFTCVAEATTFFAWICYNFKRLLPK